MSVFQKSKAEQIEITSFLEKRLLFLARVVDTDRMSSAWLAPWRLRGYPFLLGPELGAQP